MKRASNMWKTFDFGPDNLELPKKHKKNTYNVIPKTTDFSKRNFNFLSKLEPHTVQELAVHPKKVKEVEQWLEFNKNQKNKKTASFLLLTGPTGSGKTTTLKVLCKHLSLNVCEWLNPMDFDCGDYKGQSAKFLEFLSESKWNSLVCCSGDKVVIVEEFPNAILRSQEEFSSILEDCYYKSNYLIAFICTDNSTVHSLFPQELRTKFQIHTISFNQCAPTLLKAALKRAQNVINDNLDNLKMPTQQTIDAILATSMGDIRSALNQFYMASLQNCHELPVVEQRSKKKRKNTCALTLMARDENLGLFHGLGRVLNPKFTTNRIDCDIGKIVDEFSVQPTNFLNFLFENYLNYFGDFQDVVEASQILSQSTVFLDKWTNGALDWYALWSSVLGLMNSNRHKLSKWNQIRGLTRVKRQVPKMNGCTNLGPTDYFYCNLINGDQNQLF